jgi:hypothetical protein
MVFPVKLQRAQQRDLLRAGVAERVGNSTITVTM